MTMYSSRMGATGEYVSVLCPHSEGQAPAAPIGAAAPAPERTNAEWRILEFLPEPVLVVRGHTIVAVNDATLAAFGYGSKDELEGQPAAMLMQQADALEHEAAVEQHETAGDAPAIERAPRGESSPPCPLPIVHTRNPAPAFRLPPPPGELPHPTSLVHCRSILLFVVSGIRTQPLVHTAAFLVRCSRISHTARDNTDSCQTQLRTSAAVA
jgi:hypothetical protein